MAWAKWDIRVGGQRESFPQKPGSHGGTLILLLLLLLSCFSRVWLCATPYTAAHQAPPSLGFSRQEYWSGLPFPSPMHEREKWKWSRSVVSDLTTSWTAAYQAPLSMGFSRQEYWSGVPLPSPTLTLGFSKRRQGTNGKNQRNQKHARGGLLANWMIRRLLHILAKK